MSIYNNINVTYKWASILIQIWIRFKKLHFHGIKSFNWHICRNLSEWKTEIILSYLVRNFQINTRNKLRAKCLLNILPLYKASSWIKIISSSLILKIKQSTTIKENQYEANSKENPVWNKLDIIIINIINIINIIVPAAMIWAQTYI